jgi:hypothetical protein
MFSGANKLLSEGWADTSKKLMIVNVIGGGKGGGERVQGFCRETNTSPEKSLFVMAAIHFDTII